MDWGKICRNINSIKWTKLNCNIFWYIIINLACFETSGTRQEQDCAKHTPSHWTVLKGASGLENTQILYFFGTDKNSTTWELCKYARIEKVCNPLTILAPFPNRKHLWKLIAEYCKHAQGKPILSVQLDTNARKKSKFSIEKLFWGGKFSQILGITGNASVSCRLGFGKTIFVKFD